MSWQSFKERSIPALKQTVENTIAPIRLQSREERAAPAAAAASAGQGSSGEQLPPPPANPVRSLAQAGGAVMGLLSLPLELMNSGFAMATAEIANMFPALPAATLGSLYVAPPHGHLHPPSLIPPATAPIPLPSLGPVVLGTTIQVLINYLPAARAGDIGLAATCVGIMPMFEIFTGSSKVFFSGMRAARMGDFCKACVPSTSGPIRGMAKAMRNVGLAVGAASVAADLVDATQETDAHMAAADAMAAGINAAAMAIDAATTAISMAMGKDMAVPPSMGMLITGMPNVLVGGFPMPNFPDPVQLLLGKLGKKKKSKKKDADGNETCGGCGCPKK